MTGVDQDDVAAPAQPRWHLTVRGEARGPLAEASVRALLAAGEVHGDTPVSSTAEGPRHPLREDPALRTLLAETLAHAAAHDSDVWFDLPPTEAGEHGGSEVLQAEPLPDLAHDALPDPAPDAEPGLAPDAEPDVDGLPLDPEPDAFAVIDPPHVDAVSHPPGEDPQSAFALATAIHGAEPDPSLAARRPPPTDTRASRARVNVRSPRFTGQRNEDSILFSVSGSLGSGDSAPAVAPAADRDSSGLIDIARLAAAQPVPQRAASIRPPVDDLLTVGASSSLQPPLTGGLLAPPVPPAPRPALPPPPSSAINKTVVLSAVLVALIMTTGVCSVLYLLHGSGSQRPPEVPPPAVAVATPPQAAVQLPPSPPLAAVVAPPRGAPVVEAARPSPPTLRLPAAREQGSVGHTHPSPPARAQASASPPAATYHAPATQRGEDVPAVPSRAEVVEALQAISVVVRACGSGADPATVDVTFASSGRITTATVRAPYAGTPTGSCIARSVRAARLAPFGQPTFRVTYPFSLQ